jgi:hypothetical protein
LPKTNAPDLCYVYCAVEGAASPLLAVGMPDGGPPRAVALDASVTLVTSDVPSRVYAADVLEPRLSDLDWVSAAGAAHHNVLDALADAGVTVLPFRLFTLYSSEAKAVASLRESRTAIAQAFDRIRGKQEWVLRIGKPSGEAPAAARPLAAPQSGTTFLQAKAEAKREAAARATRVQHDATAAFEALKELADAVKTRPVDTGGNLIMDAAFLVPPSRVEALRDTLTGRAEGLLADGCSVSLTGPWPPYSFAAMDASHG